MDLFGISPTNIDVAVTDRRLDEVADADLAVLVSSVLGRPRTADTSFTLHAPLELLARIQLLDRATAPARPAARRRLISLAARYDHSGEAVPAPAGPIPSTAPEAAMMLGQAIGYGDPDQADQAALALARSTPAELGPLLGDTIVTSLGAAGHAPIALALWPRIDPAVTLDGAMTRHLLRNLATGGDLRFEIEHPNTSRSRGSLSDLATALAAVDPIGDPGFGIYPLMHQAEAHGAIARFPAVESESVADAFRLVLRRAATAMLTDDPDHTPYGWSHALTMPLALTQIAPHLADATLALDVALTEWCGFRMGHGRGAVVEYQPTAPNVALDDALDRSLSEAAGAAWHHPNRAQLVATLIDNAAVSHDAHLAKYTVAALDAASFDPGHDRLYLAAAARLAGWWRRHPAGDDLLSATGPTSPPAQDTSRVRAQEPRVG